MTEAEIDDVKEQENVAPVTAEEEIPPPKAPEPKENSKEYNWRRMEQKLGELDRRNAELAHALQEAKSQKVSSEEIAPEADDLVNYGQLNRVAEQQARRILEEELAKREKAALPAQVKSQYTDYDQVVTPENVEQLIKEDPDLEHDISVSRNPFARAYKAIKASEFYRSSVESKDSRDKITGNSAKPISGNALGSQRPLSQANAYAKGSPELFAEMQKYRKGSL